LTPLPSHAPQPSPVPILIVSASAASPAPHFMSMPSSSAAVSTPRSTASHTQARVADDDTASMPSRLHASWHAVISSMSSLRMLAPNPTMVS
jgi:hypothetical protein